MLDISDIIQAIAFCKSNEEILAFLNKRIIEKTKLQEIVENLNKEKK